MKKFLKLFLITFISIFICNVSVVKAESDNLVCIYYNDGNSSMYTYTMLIFEENRLEEFKYSQNMNLTGNSAFKNHNYSEWKSHSLPKNNLVDISTSRYDSRGNLVSCPTNIIYNATWIGSDMPDIPGESEYRILTITDLDRSTSSTLYTTGIYVSNSNTNSSGNTTNNGNMGNTNVKLDECKSLLGDPKIEGTPAFYMSVVFDVIKYVAIILLIGLSMMDLIGAVASHDNDSLKKAVGKIMKRVVLCIILLILPVIIDLILGLLNDSGIRDCLEVDGAVK